MQYEFMRFDPSQVPALTSALDAAVTKLDTNLKALDSAGRLPEPWLGDEVSRQAAAVYHQAAIEGDRSALGVLKAYVEQMREVIDQLNATVASYPQADATAAASLPKI